MAKSPMSGTMKNPASKIMRQTPTKMNISRLPEQKMMGSIPQENVGSPTPAPSPLQAPGAMPMGKSMKSGKKLKIG